MSEVTFKFMISTRLPGLRLTYSSVKLALETKEGSKIFVTYEATIVLLP